MSDTHHGGGHGPTSFLTKYVFSTDHKVIGIQFMFASLLFVILGGLLALAVRYQLAWPNQDVPYASLLPGQMTSQAPEANLALWKPGREVEVAAGAIEGEDEAVVGRLAGFPDGLAVSVPAGTVVSSAAGAERVLEAPVSGFVPASSVVGGYQYSKQQAQALAGTAVTIAGEGDGAASELTLSGVEQWAGGHDGREVAERVSGPIMLNVVQALTPVDVEVEGEVVRVTGAQATYYKEALTTDAYLQLFTMHASIMIFFVIIPMLVGAFGNFLIPLMIGARDMAFPKLNMLSFWLAAPAGVVMLLSFWTQGGAAGGGWTMYPPFSEAAYSSQLGTTLWIASVGLVGFSSVVGALNYITTTINMRAPGMGLFRMPLTVWSILITSVLAVFATPVLTAAMVLLLLDRELGTVFFLPAEGGQPLLFQHLFWFYSHPAVYIMILPAMGVTSDILSTCSRKPIFGYKPMVYAMMAITGLGFIVWGHHMFQSGMNPVLGTTFMASTIMIAVPSAIKTFNWMGTLWGGDIRFTPAMLNAIGFVSMFVIGGLSGIFMASAPVDIPMHDTYFIVAHIHYVLFGGSMFGIFAGVYHWFPKMFGRQLNQKWGVIHFVMTILAFNGTFFLMHILGIGGHPRRYAAIMEYPTMEHLQPMNVFMTICAMMLGMAQLPFFFNVFASLPRRLGRAVVAFFVVMLGLPMVMGLSYWGAFEAGGCWVNDVTYNLWGHHLVLESGETGFSDGQRMLGYALALIVLAKLAVLMLWQLPKGGRIATVVCGAPVVALVLYLIKLGTSEALTGELEADMVSWKAYHDVLVVGGLSMIYLAAVVIAVWVVWAVGGALKMPRVLNLLLWVVALPAFLMPLIFKPDTYLWIGSPQWYQWRWVILGVTALPGLLHVLTGRAGADRFGFDVGINPWNANSLEWSTSSPPPHTNFDEIPTVHRGPYEYSSPVVELDFLPQVQVLPPGVVEPSGH